MEPIIRSGQNEILCSGVAFTYGDSSLEIGVREHGSESVVYWVRFAFTSDQNDTNSRFEFNPILNEAATEIRAVNYSSTLGSGYVTPIRLATSQNGQSLWLSFMISAWNGTSGHKIEYTVFKQTEVSHG